MNRKGYTLIELLVALLLFSIVGVAIMKSFVLHQRTFTAQTQRIDVQQNLRTGMKVLPTDLRQLDAVDGDLVSMSATSITIRSLRQLGIVCATPVVVGNAVTAIVDTLHFYGTPKPFNAVNDSIFFYYEGDETIRTDDAWLPGKLATTPVTLPTGCSNGKPGYSFTTSAFILGAGQSLSRIQKGAPIRGYRQITYGLMTTGGRYYVGRKEASGTMYPLIGPLVGANGLTFTFYSSTGAQTLVPSQVTQVGITILEQTQLQIRGALGTLTYKTDSLTTRVALRNNPRF